MRCRRWTPEDHLSSAIAACTAVATTALAAGSAGPAFAAGSPQPFGCDPIACAAAYIGVSRSALADDIVNETTRTGIFGTQVAIDQLDTAMANKLSAIAPAASAAALAMSYWVVIANHDAIRDAVLSAGAQYGSPRYEDEIGPGRRPRE